MTARFGELRRIARKHQATVARLVRYAGVDCLSLQVSMQKREHIAVLVFDCLSSEHGYP